MKAESINLNQIRQAGLEVLSRELGPVKMVRFLQQFEMGQGDYTKERQALHENKKQSVKELVEQIRKNRKA